MYILIVFVSGTMASLFLLLEQWLNYGKEVFVYCDLCMLRLLCMATNVFVYCDLCMAAWGLSMNFVL